VQGGGESIVQLFDRSTSALDRIAMKHIGRLISESPSGITFAM